MQEDLPYDDQFNDTSSSSDDDADDDRVRLLRKQSLLVNGHVFCLLSISSILKKNRRKYVKNSVKQTNVHNKNYSRTCSNKKQYNFQADKK
jgi:hypothetical protein